MKLFVAFSSFMFVLLVVVALCYGAYYTFGYLWGIYTTLDPVVRVILLSSMSVLLVSALIIAGSIKSATRSMGKSKVLQTKYDLYKLLIEACVQHLTNPHQASQETVTKLRGLDTDLILLASSPVLNSYRKLLTTLHNHEDSEKYRDLVQQLIKNIRRDMGHAPLYDEAIIKNIMVPDQPVNTDKPDHAATLT